MTTAPRVLALIACDLCQRKDAPPHDEHTGTGCDLWRTFGPYTELQRQGYGKEPGRQMSGSEWSWKDDAALEGNVDVIAAWYDAVVLPRLSWADHRIGARFIAALHRAGLCVIGEYDDDLVSPEINRRIQQTHEPDTDLIELERKRLDRLAALRLMDGLTVSSRRLATVLRTQFDAPVCVVPNAIDVGFWRRARKQAKRIIPGLTVGWAGGARPDVDLRPMAWAWGQLAQSRPDVTFVVYGHQPDILAEYVPAHRVRRIPWHPLEAYPLPFRNIDIGCAAVNDDPFSRCKTPIKVWEYTLGGAAVVATPALYGQTVDNGVDGLLAETPQEWLLALRTLVDDAQMRKRLRLEQRRRIAQFHTLERNAFRWPLAWGQIVDSFRQSRQRPRLIAV